MTGLQDTAKATATAMSTITWYDKSIERAIATTTTTTKIFVVCKYYTKTVLCKPCRLSPITPPKRLGASASPSNFGKIQQLLQQFKQVHHHQQNSNKCAISSSNKQAIPHSVIGLLE
jgi:hypothetical protein